MRIQRSEYSNINQDIHEIKEQTEHNKDITEVKVCTIHSWLEDRIRHRDITCTKQPPDGIVALTQIIYQKLHLEGHTTLYTFTHTESSYITQILSNHQYDNRNTQEYELTDSVSSGIKVIQGNGSQYDKGGSTTRYHQWDYRKEHKHVEDDFLLKRLTLGLA